MGRWQTRSSESQEETKSEQPPTGRQVGVTARGARRRGPRSHPRTGVYNTPGLKGVHRTIEVELVQVESHRGRTIERKKSGTRGDITAEQKKNGKSDITVEREKNGKKEQQKDRKEETSRDHSSNKQVDSEPQLFVDVEVRVFPSLVGFYSRVEAV